MQIKRILPTIFKKGSQVAAAISIPVIQASIPDPTGIIPNTIGVLITTTGEVIADTLDRNMSQQELIRTHKAYVYFVEKLENNLNQGLQVRNDDFFRFRVGYRKPAEELFEGILLKSKNQYEEEKIRFFSNLYANACTDESLTTEIISMLISILDKITLNHLDILNRFVLLGENSKWEWNDLTYLETKSIVLPSCLEELKNLRLLTLDAWGDSQIQPTSIGKKLINSISFINNFESCSNEIITRNVPIRS